MLLSGLILLFLPQGQVHVVDAAGGPGSDFTTLGAAVGAAADGDVVLVRAGDYFDDGFDTEGIFLDGKGVTVVADTGAAVRTRSARVQNLPAASQVLIQGLTFTWVEPVADLDADQGPVWFERCTFQPQFDLTSAGFLPTDCDSVVLSRSELHAVPILVPTTALRSQGSRLHVFDSLVQGEPNAGLLPAVVLEQGSFVELLGSTVHGGDGEPGNLLFCNGGPGGDALSVADASTLVTLDAVLQGGAGGPPSSGCDPGPDGEDLIVVDGTVVPLTGTARSMEIASPVRTDETIQVTLTGLPGDRVWLKYSFAPGTGQAAGAYDGEYLLAAPRFKAFTATLPASGTLVVSAPSPELPAGVESFVVYCQAFFRDAAGLRFVLSSPSGLVLLDPSL